MNVNLFIQVKLHLKSDYLGCKETTNPKTQQLILILVELKADSLWLLQYFE